MVLEFQDLLTVHLPSVHYTPCPQDLQHAYAESMHTELYTSWRACKCSPSLSQTLHKQISHSLPELILGFWVEAAILWSWVRVSPLRLEVWCLASGHWGETQMTCKPLP